MDILKKVHREITPLSPEDSFLVFDRVKDDFDFPIHFHPEYELNFISNGKGVKRVVGDSIEEIEEVELVLVGPNLHHGWLTHNCKNDDIHEITIQFHQHLFADEFLSRKIMKPIKEMFDRSVHGILFSKKVALDLKERISRLSRIDGIDYFLEIISILHDLANSRNQRLLSTYTVNRENFENSDKIKTVYEYVQENFDKKITLSEVSELVNMSNVSFNRFMKKRTGKTFVDYVNDVRIGYASMWLLERDNSISEIAFNCGFNNIANFNRVFKKLKNCTPSQYKTEFSGIKRIL
ncbi:MULTISPECIES: AraC family transcriptional regulator [Flavobacteriaceae]|uniref:AraC family transcriptional regulator n=2 Tax=Flavobacteriaceae TaxID=49546 RepID=A0ABP3UT46_9FLAO|nr:MULTISPECIES: AraC family transcriptional regulator [Flavobacteriaceae]RYH75721.1 AraC family transcriptional regulator [Flavobacteriaceae bacterium 144Ye]TBV27834.1 AraC family transcriptional regulator [Meridianimaribacter sp. CL38]TDY13995.1 AraC family transcriptional regulator [Meridianimaribacter flavus]